MSPQELHAARQSLRQLGTVVSSRRRRLEQERTALLAKEQDLQLATQAQQRDESLLADQWVQWHASWRAWAQGSGRLGQTKGLRQDKELLQQMRALTLARGAQLQAHWREWHQQQADWQRRQRSLDVLQENLDERALHLRRQAARAGERAQEEAFVFATKALPSVTAGAA